MFRAFSENLKLLSSELVIIWMLETTHVIRFGMLRQERRYPYDGVRVEVVDYCMLSIRV